MEDFVKKLAFYLCYFVLVLVAFFFINNHLFKTVNKQAYSDINTLILGDSHSRFLNEEIIPNCQNLSYSAETYKVAYFKLKYLSELNNLDNVILSFSYNNFSFLHESRMLNEYRTIYRLYPIASPHTLLKTTNSCKNAVEVLSSYVFSFNKDYVFKYFSKTDLYENSPLDENIIYKSIGKAKLANENSKFYNFILDKKIEALDKKINRRLNHHYNYKDSGDYISNLAVDYFKMIIELCKEKNIQLYLITLPLHQKYRDRIPPFYVENYENLASIAKSYDHINLINLEKYFDGKPELMLDQDHQSEYGGALISKHLVNKYLN